MSAPRPRSNAWLLIGAASLVVIALGAGVGLGWKSRGAGNAAGASTLAASKPNIAPPPSAVALPALTTAAPPTPAANEPPSISVDSLPGTNSGTKALGPVPHGSGRVLVTAAPGWCNLTVDGKERGPTPVVGLDLSAGPHQLRCDGPGGKVKTTSITVSEGATSRVKLALDD